MSALLIRQYQPADSIPEITELIHVAYKQLADMGLKFWGTWQDESVTLERIHDSYLTLVGVQDDKIVATISLYSSKENHKCEHYRTAWYFGQFAVRPDIQKTGIGSAMLEHIEEKAKSAGAKLIALDTAEPAIHLIRYYEKRGYAFVQHQQWEKTNYKSVILSKALH